jgi:predicted anti-sigma-YlaC factor YlaD
MDCRKSRELILTDYIDDQVTGNEKTRLEEHLTHCAECKNFYEVAVKSAKEPFLNIQAANPPEYLWRRIKETILTEEEKRNAFIPGLFARLKKVLYIPRPAFAIISAAMLFLVIGTAIGVRINNNVFRLNAEDQYEYFSYLAGSPEDGSVNGNGSFGTQLEKYFL